MKVSALIITYNQERFISEAIDSALMQETDFDFEIVVSEDCSTDRTREIVQDYEVRHPEHIRVLYSPHNLGGVENFVLAYHSCRGGYIALLEGDDYWTSPLKLQKQADFLDQRRECSMCVHGAVEVFEDGRPPVSWIAPDQKEISTLEDLLLNNFVHSGSAMLRKPVFDDYPGWVYEWPFADYPLWIQAATHGHIGYIKEFLGAYRVHAEGFWSGRDVIFQVEQMIAFYERLRRDLGREYDQIFDRVLARFHAQLACERAGVPRNATVLVVSGGDQELLKLYRDCRHFPSASGLDNGPINDRAWIESLERARAGGAEFLLFPRTMLSCLGGRETLRPELNRRYWCVWQTSDARLYDLRDGT